MAPHHFRFFALPLELQDDIYDRLFEDIDVSEPREIWCYLRSPGAHARSISKQFKTEYDKWATKDHQVQVISPYESTYVHQRARDAPHLILELSVYTHSDSCGQENVKSCEVTQAFDRYTSWITEFCAEAEQA